MQVLNQPTSQRYINQGVPEARLVATQLASNHMPGHYVVLKRRLELPRRFFALRSPFPTAPSKPGQGVRGDIGSISPRALIPN
jgi:hypothetical protein